MLGKENRPTKSPAGETKPGFQTPLPEQKRTILRLHHDKSFSLSTDVADSAPKRFTHKRIFSGPDSSAPTQNHHASQFSLSHEPKSEMTKTQKTDFLEQLKESRQSPAAGRPSGKHRLR